MNTFVRLSTVIVFAAVALGAVVCATDSSAACPNWPGCYPGHIAPAFELNPMIEFVHRVVSASTAPMLLVTAIIVRRYSTSLVRWLPWLALVGALGAGVFGMLTIRRGLSSGESMVDLWCALTALVAMTIVSAQLLGNTASNPVRARAAGATVVGLGLMHGAGVLVAGDRSFTRCMGWPMGISLEADHHVTLQIARAVLAVGLLIACIWLRSAPVFVALIVEFGAGVWIRSTTLTDLNGSIFGIAAVAIVAAVAWEWGRAIGPHVGVEAHRSLSVATTS